jgi:RimJ/RimL family protein N-acetyltransferase
MPWAEAHPDPQIDEVLVLRFSEQYAAQTDFVLGIWDRTVLVGGTGFHLRHGPREVGIAEIGMWLAADRVGQGLGKRVLRAMLQWGFSAAWGFRRLVWVCDAANGPSAAVARGCRMIHEGTLRQHLPRVGGGWADAFVFAMLREDASAAREMVAAETDGTAASASGR